MAEQLKDEKDLFVGFGNFIPHSRLKEESDKVKELQNQLAERDKQLTELADSNKSNAELKAQIEKLTAENQKAAENYETQIYKVKQQAAVMRASGGKKEADRLSAKAERMERIYRKK